MSMKLGNIWNALAHFPPKRCHYARMAINPECCSCDGKNTECSGFTEPFTVESKELRTSSDKHKKRSK